MGNEFQDFYRGGQQSTNVETEARTVASLLDAGRFEQAQQRLLNDLQNRPEDFQQIVTRADQYEKSQYGADIILTPVNNNGNFYDRNGWNNGNGNWNNNGYQRDYMVSLIMPYSQQGGGARQQMQGFVRSDLAIITLGARPLDGKPYFTR
ncbi:MAG: hypothetical protein KC777_11175 [Cyanobacteria bacterium HKST-UBA02]|nr:hypothetical protein [Cyanobacteria bacterium HKST-UBA02]